MTDNLLGTYQSLEAVHVAHPLGGIQGDYVIVGDSNYYWNPLSLEWTKEKPTVTVPANKIKEKNNLGNFANILEVYSRYPDGGKEGDYLFIDGIEYVWNRWERIWQSKGDTTPTGGRTTNTFDGDLAVENDLIVGGILRVKGFSFDNPDTPGGSSGQGTPATMSLKTLNEFPTTPEQAIAFVKEKNQHTVLSIVENGINVGILHIYADQFRQVLTEVIETRLLVNGTKVGGGHVYSEPIRYWRNYGLRQDYSGIKKYQWTLWRQCKDDTLVRLNERLDMMFEIYNASPNGQLYTLREVVSTVTDDNRVEFKRCMMISFLSAETKKRVYYVCTTTDRSKNENDWKQLTTEDNLEQTKQHVSALPFDGYVDDVQAVSLSAADDAEDSNTPNGLNLTPENKKGVMWDRVKNVFVYQKGDTYYTNWKGADDYGELAHDGRKPAVGILFYHRIYGNACTWNGSKMLPIIGGSKTEIIEDATRITEEEINNIVNE